MLLIAAGILVFTCALPAVAVPGAGDEAPSFVARDIHGNEVDLDKIIQGKPDMVILFFFTTASGEEAALKLRRLDMLYKDKLKIIAFGFKDDEAALKSTGRS
jgi:peroxiredoxin